MRTEILYESGSLYRDSFQIRGYVFGSGEKSLCVVGNMRGNEYQQLYTCSRLIQRLKRAEEADALRPGHEIMVIPSANPYSMNIQKRFWPIDNTDINRMFPGYDQGETTQRIAAGIFEKIKDFTYGVQFASNYMTGVFLSYVNVMTTGFEDTEKASAFGLPYVVLRHSRPYDTTTLNYNWQIWGTKAFSLYTTSTETIDRESADRGVEAVLSFLAGEGIYLGKTKSHAPSVLVDDSQIVAVRTPEAGLFEPSVQVEQRVTAGALLARVLDPVEGEVRSRLYAPVDGIVYYLHAGPLTYSHTAVVKMIPL
ncbi:MAG: M14 family metallopeptidase [Eubacteriales bacterium]|nr:M14 family metallopeptidase [Eubacteriales bacterium]